MTVPGQGHLVFRRTPDHGVAVLLHRGRAHALFFAKAENRSQDFLGEKDGSQANLNGQDLMSRACLHRQQLSDWVWAQCCGTGVQPVPMTCPSQEAAGRL